MNTITTLVKKQYNEETHNMYSIDKTKTYNIKNNKYIDGHYYNKAQNVNNDITNNISKENITPNNEHVLNLKKHSKNHISNNYKPQTAYVGNKLYKRSDNRTFDNTNNISKNIYQYITDVVNNHKPTKFQI